MTTINNTSADAERAAFEGYAAKHSRPGTTLRRSFSGDYVDNRIASKWATWQAARATPATADVAADNRTKLLQGQVDALTALVESQQRGHERELRLALAAGAPAETVKAAGFDAARRAYITLTNSAVPTDNGGAHYIATQEMMRAFDAYFAHPTTAPGDGEKALRFADEILSAVLKGSDFDGGHLQEMATEHGLLRAEDMAGPCGENCACASDGVEFWPSQCFRKTYALPPTGATKP